MNKIIKKFCKDNDIKPIKIEKRGKRTIIYTEDNAYCLKVRERLDNNDIYDYLKSRSFNYYPKELSISNDDVIVREYISENKIPKEQKILDLINLMSLLHLKTTHYKEVDLDDYKEIYENLKNNVVYLTSYYNDLISIVESSVIMSPKEYLLARNISIIFRSLYFCEVNIERWYNLVKEKRKQRVVVLHNNLKLSHILRNEKSYFINWDKAKIGIPIFDFYKLYKAHYLDFDFSELLKQYEHNYPLQEEERLLLFILISMPVKIEFNDSEFNCCKFISNHIDELIKASNLISPYQSKETKKQ